MTDIQIAWTVLAAVVLVLMYCSGYIFAEEYESLVERTAVGTVRFIIFLIQAVTVLGVVIALLFASTWAVFTLVKA